MVMDQTNDLPAPHTSGAASMCLLNDQLRREGIGGRTVLTRGLAALPTDELAAVLRAVAGFSEFTVSNDTYGEHDCGVLDVAGHSVLWKIDYYDLELGAHSLDPSDPTRTCRVLTIMLSEEY